MPLDSVNNSACKFIACGPNGGDLNWTKGFFEEYKYNGRHQGSFYGISLHYYCGAAGHPLSFNEDEYYQLLSQANEMDKLIKRHRSVMDYYDQGKTLGILVDEWGCWHQGGTGPSKGYNLFEQQVTVRDALVSALTLNIFNNNCDSVTMANTAQLCNNLHTLYFAGKENFVETPNYFVFDMYKTHQNGRHIKVADDFETIKVKDREDIKSVSVSASENENGELTITFANMDYSKDKEIKLSSFGKSGKIFGTAEITVLASNDARAYNSFENPTAVKPVKYNKDIVEGEIIALPKASVVSVVIKNKS
jgi:alpha-N-arabinofuranosidase